MSPSISLPYFTEAPRRAMPPDEIAALVRFQIVCERGKEALGEGNNSLGEQVPGMFAELGLRDVQVCLNDKASLLLPPYGTPAQRALVEDVESCVAREI